MAEYIDDYDDEGNPIRVKVTKALLRKQIEQQAEALDRSRQRAREQYERAVKAENRLDAKAFGASIANAIADGKTPLVVEASLKVHTEYIDVGPGQRQIPGSTNGVLLLELHGETEVLDRLGKALFG